ncbi:MAG: SDR family oxidoreductase [Actinomycetota bacterium]
MPGPVMMITGASDGIGAAVARAAVADGWRVVIAARRRDLLDALSADLGGASVALPATCDVTEWDQVQAMADAAVGEFGRIDAVLANAGFGAKRGFLAESPEFWRQMILTNVYGAAITLRACIPALRESRGHAVLMGSISGRQVGTGSLYSSSKWAVTAMAEAARKDLHGTGVRVTLIAPGIVDTAFYDDPPGGDPLVPDDVARAVMFAVSQPPHVSINEVYMRPTEQEF